MLSKLVKMRLDSQFCRMNCQMFSCAFNSGERGGSGSSEMLLGTCKQLCPVPPRLVEQHDSVRSGRDAGGGHVEVVLHGLAVATRHHNGRALSQCRTDSTEQIGRLRSLIMRGPWARPFLAQR